MKNIKNNKGFTLVELIVVMAIMAILVGALAPQVVKYVEKARESKDLQVISTIFTAIQSETASYDVTSTALTNATIDSTITAYPKIGDLLDTKLKTNANVKLACKSKVGKEGVLCITYSPTTGELKVGIKATDTSTDYTIGPVTN